VRIEIIFATVTRGC